MPDRRRIKALLKRSCRAGARMVGPMVLHEAARTRILTYHSVGYRRHEMNVTPASFAAQIAWLVEHYQVIPLARAAEGECGVAITFDDGYRDNLLNALPVLEQYGCPATIFVVSGSLGNTLPLDVEPDSGVLLTESELRQVASRGVEIGGHTRTHRRLSRLSEEEQHGEIAGCKADLERVVGKPITAFAYPFGSALDYDDTSVHSAREAGYAFACSNRYGPVGPMDDQFTLRRIWIDSTDTLASFQDKVSGRLDLLGFQDSEPGIRTRRWLNRFLGIR